MTIASIVVPTERLTLLDEFTNNNYTNDTIDDRNESNNILNTRNQNVVVGSRIGSSSESSSINNVGTDEEVGQQQQDFEEIVQQEEERNDDDGDRGRVSSSSSSASSSSSSSSSSSLNDIEEDSADDEVRAVEAAEMFINLLTRRLRCIFGILTWPTIPLGSVVVLAMIYFIYTALFVDVPTKDCAHHTAINGYAISTIVIASYIPYHSLIRDRFFHYRRDRDGPNRPTIVRRYDQIIHTLSLLYVYAGVTVLETCREDIPVNDSTNYNLDDNNSNNTTTDATNDLLESTSGTDNLLYQNTCEATCPNVATALSIYVTTLEIFTLSLIIPLLFLPCVYLWFLRQAATNTESIALLQERINRERDDQQTSPGGMTNTTAETPLLLSSLTRTNHTFVSVGEILSKLHPVLLVLKPKSNKNKSITITDRQNHMECSENENNTNISNQTELWIVSDPNSHTTSKKHRKSKKDHNNCVDIEGEPSSSVVDDSNNSNDDNAIVSINQLATGSNVTECCICMCDFDIQDEHEDHTVLVRGDGVTDKVSSHQSSLLDQDNLDVEAGTGASQTTKDNVDSEPTSTILATQTVDTDSSLTIVRTVACGHLFHLRCITSWIGGRVTTVSPSLSLRRQQHQNRRRRAQRTTCPLCRQDLRGQSPRQQQQQPHQHQQYYQHHSQLHSVVTPNYNTFG